MCILKEIIKSYSPGGVTWVRSSQCVSPAPHCVVWSWRHWAGCEPLTHLYIKLAWWLLSTPVLSVQYFYCCSPFFIYICDLAYFKVSIPSLWPRNLAIVFYRLEEIVTFHLPFSYCFFDFTMPLVSVLVVTPQLCLNSLFLPLATLLSFSLCTVKFSYFISSLSFC